jgi:hypothetical protein
MRKISFFFFHQYSILGLTFYQDSCTWTRSHGTTSSCVCRGRTCPPWSRPCRGWWDRWRCSLAPFIPSTRASASTSTFLGRVWPTTVGLSSQGTFTGHTVKKAFRYSRPQSLVSDIPAGDGNIEKIFLRCMWGNGSKFCHSFLQQWWKFWKNM